MPCTGADWGQLQYTALSKFPESATDFIFFADEKVFTVAPPVNLQNNRVYEPYGTKKCDIAADRLLRTWPTFSKFVIVRKRNGKSHFVYDFNSILSFLIVLPKLNHSDFGIESNSSWVKDSKLTALAVINYTFDLSLQTFPDQ